MNRHTSGRRNSVWGRLRPLLAIVACCAALFSGPALLRGQTLAVPAQGVEPLPTLGQPPPGAPGSGPPSVLSEMPGPQGPQDPDPPPPGPAMPLLNADSFQPIFRLHQTISHTPGDAGELTTMGGFIPHVMDDGIWYVDGQFDILESTNNPGEQTLNFASNLGFGFRWYDPAADNVLGLSFWYDCDRSRPQFAHQGSIGLEMLGPVWSWRANGYFPVTSNRETVGFGPLGTPFFSGFNILFPRTRFDQLSMTGMDNEFGRRLPGWLGENGVSLYGGYYYYEADKGLHTFGGSARLEALVSRDLSIGIKATTDPLFKNELAGSITWMLPLGRCKKSQCNCNCNNDCDGDPDLHYRLIEPPQRNRTIVFGGRTASDPEVATDPTTGLAIRVVHVDSNVAAGGNGTFETPFQTLPTAQAGSLPGDIVYLHAGSTFDGQSFVLQNNQRLLGEGIDHTVNTAQAGTILLPSATGGSVLPIIQNSPGTAAVTLANNNEVSGLQIKTPAGAAILANGVSGTENINNNQITGGTVGLSVQNSSAAFSVSATPISGAATGIQLLNDTGAFAFTGLTTVSGSTVNGVSISGQMTGNVSFDDVAISATSGTGFLMSGSAVTLTIGAGTISNASGTALSLTGATLAVSLSNVTGTGGVNGIVLNQDSGTIAINGGTISGTTSDGISISNSTGVTLSGMTITDAAGNGITVNASNQITIQGLTINQSASTGNGIYLSGNGSGITISNTSITVPAGAVGIVVLSGSAILSDNTITGSGVNSIGLDVVDGSAGGNSFSINGNAINLSGTGTYGIDLINFGGTADTLSGTISNAVTASVPFSSVGPFSGTIIVNGVPEP